MRINYLRILLVVLILIISASTNDDQDFSLIINDFTDDQFDLKCHSDKLIITENFENKVQNLQKQLNISAFHVENCKLNISVIELVEVIKKELNCNIKKLTLTEIDSLEADNLNGFDNYAKIRDLSLEFNDKNISENVFLNVSNMEKLLIQISRVEQLPDLSYLRDLEILIIIITKHETENQSSSQRMSVNINFLSQILANTNITLKGIGLLIDYPIKKTQLHRDYFLYQPSLEVIQLRMQIENIHEKTFLQLKNLTVLNLSNNQIIEFETKFLPSENLKILKLKHNQLSSFIIKKPFDKLIELDLAINNLKTFTLNSDVQLKSLEIVKLSMNNLKHVDIIPSNIIPLKYLELTYTLLDGADVLQWAFDNRNKTETDLENSYILCDCQSIKVITDLKNKWEHLYKRDDILYCCHLTVSSTIVLINFDDFPCNESEDDFKIFFGSNLDPIKREWSAISSIVVNHTKSSSNSSEVFINHHFIQQIVSYYSKEDINEMFFIYYGDFSNIKSLPLLSKIEFKNIKKIHIKANGCKITNISRENLPANTLNSLNLANNHINTLEIDVIDYLFERKTEIDLNHNSISCTCADDEIRRKIKTLKLLNQNDLMCSDGVAFNFDRELCISPWIYFLYFVLTISIITSIGLIIYLRHSLEFKVLIYANGLFSSFFHTEADDKEYNYDVFLSYSEKDSDFIEQFLKLLEQDQDPPFKVCYHHRDWNIGQRIDHQILNSIEKSRKTIIVLSPNFLQSLWGNFEFMQAHYKMLETKSPKILLILHGNIDNDTKLQPELKAYIRTTTYLTSNDKWFEKKLLFALRRPKIVEKEEIMHEENENEYIVRT
uniref:CSON014613 protein n=1 Tax=Culicoides sonorensis TaxID=179676 RepID=A0A336MB22_CULSO